VQARGHVRPNGNTRPHGEEIRRKNFGPDVFTRKCNFSEIVQMAAKKLDFDTFARSRSQRKNGTHRRGEFGQGRVRPGGPKYK
jgi:hypothetical protein